MVEHAPGSDEASSTVALGASAPVYPSSDELGPLVELSVDAIVSVDERERIVLFNAGAEAAFGYKRAEVIGTPLSTLIPERYRKKHSLDLASFGRSGTSARMMGDRGGIVALRKDGSEFPAEASISSFLVQGKPRYCVVLRDVTERRKSLERLARNEEAIRRLYELAAVRGMDLTERLRKVLELGVELFGMQSGRVSRAWGHHREVIATWGERAKLPEESALTAEGSRLDAPLVVAGEAFGLLSFSSAHPRPESFDASERELVNLMASWVGRAIEVQQRQEIVERLATAREALMESFAFADIRAIVARLAVPFLAEASILYAPTGVRRVLRSEAKAGSDMVEEEVGVEELLEREGKPHPPLDMIRKGSRTPRVFNRSVRAESADYGSDWLRGVGYASSFVVPVVARGTVIAVQALLSSKPSRYAPHEQELAAELATLAGFALAHGQATEAAEAAVRARDDLLSFVSHDLGNPIATISMVTERLLAQPTGEDRREEARFYMEGIRDSATRMERLVHDLLEVHVLESGHRGVRPAPLLATTIVSEVLREFRYAADAKSIQLDGSANDGVVLLGDRDRLFEVLINLLDNAVKFSNPGGTIRVTAELEGRQVLFSVANSGIGITQEQISRLFDRHIQAREKRRAGAGLGLTIAKQIVEQHGGSIWCESVVGEGATFRFTVPTP
jgi:PAS domain S-box-containing protein